LEKKSGRGRRPGGRSRPEVQGLLFLGNIYLDFVFLEFSEINCRINLDLFVFAGGREGCRGVRNLPFKDGDYYCRGADAPGLTIDQVGSMFVLRWYSGITISLLVISEYYILARSSLCLIYV